VPGQPLFVTRKFPPSVGGMETLAATVWRVLEHGAPGALLVAHGGSNRELPRWLPAALLRVGVLLARRRAEPVLVGDALMYTILLPLLRLFRVPSATMVMGLDLTYDNPVYRAVVHRALRRAPRVLAISTATADVARSFGIPAERVGIIRLGVEAPQVGAADRRAAAQELRRSHGLPGDAVVLLTLGRLVPRKGARWFVANVLPNLPANVVHLIVGEGPERDAIRKAAAAAGVGDRVHLAGRVDDVDRETILRGADVFVQPNVPVPGDMEGFGLVAVEAAMRGTLTVASGIEGLRDAVLDGETGVLLPAGDAAAWVGRLHELTGDMDELRRRGARFQARARELYGEDEMARQLFAELGKLR